MRRLGHVALVLLVLTVVVAVAVPVFSQGVTCDDWDALLDASLDVGIAACGAGYYDACIRGARLVLDVIDDMEAAGCWY